jgi:hypothetical protein
MRTIKDRNKLRVKIKGPRFSIIAGIADSGTLFAIPAILYLLIMRYVTGSEEQLAWRVQIIKHFGLADNKVVSEETYDTQDEARKRYLELEQQITKGELTI